MSYMTSMTSYFSLHYLVNLLQFLCHTYHLHPESTNKSHGKATLCRLASHAFRDASHPI